MDRPFQLSLVSFFVLQAFVGLALVAIALLGLATVLWTTMGLVLFSLVAARAPDLAKYGSVLGVMAIVSWSLLVIEMRDARETARRRQRENNLRHMGSGMFIYSDMAPSARRQPQPDPQWVLDYILSSQTAPSGAE